MGKTCLTAEQAKAKAVASEGLLNSIYRAIDDHSRYGACKMDVCFDNLIQETIDVVVKSLVEKGYTIEPVVSKAHKYKDTPLFYDVTNASSEFLEKYCDKGIFEVQLNSVS